MLTPWHHVVEWGKVTGSAGDDAIGNTILEMNIKCQYDQKKWAIFVP